MNDLMLLAMLLDGPRHGYALKKQAGMLLGKENLHNNMVYPSLRRFVRGGWVVQRLAAGERGQTRLIYALTAKGRKELVDRLSEFPPAEVRSSPAFELRVGLFGILPANARHEILKRREESLRAADARLARLQREMDLGEFGAEVVRFKRENYARELAWIERVGRKAGKSDKDEKSRTRRSRR